MFVGGGWLGCWWCAVVGWVGGGRRGLGWGSRFLRRSVRRRRGGLSRRLGWGSTTRLVRRGAMCMSLTRAAMCFISSRLGVSCLEK